MSQPPYGTWPPNNVKSEDYSSAGYSHSDPHHRLQSRAGTRPASSTSSSLSGAMGEPTVSSRPRPSGTPPSGLAWSPSHGASMPSTSYMVPDDGGMGYLATPVSGANTSGTFAAYQQQYTMPMYAEPSSTLSSPGFPDHFAYAQSGAQINPAAMMISPSSTPAPPPMHSHSHSHSHSRSSRSPQDKLEDELRRLQQRIRELELVNESSRRRIKELEAEVSRGGMPGFRGGVPSALPTPQPQPTFAEDWRVRTDARVKLFCSLNRAGNALCAWHDSRRERRAYPPRNAPPGYLNCGCTYDEALFEESLARHGVGSYLPGDSVRMDPALRNPLLRLLQERYGYRDGDFERDRATGNWIDGEGGAVWEAKAASGTTFSKRNRG